MNRSKIDELKFLRSNNFSRPTTSKFLSANRKDLAILKEKTHRIQYQSKIYPATPAIAKSDLAFQDMNQFTPAISKSQISTYRTCTSNLEYPKVTFPYKNQEFLSSFKSIISKHEALEILDYPSIYYWGKSQKTNCLFSYDDDKSYYQCWENDHIAYRYRVVKLIGKGTFSNVFEAVDHKTSQSVAVKILRSQKRFSAQGTNEVKILNFIQQNKLENLSYCIDIKDYFIFRNHICIITDLLPMSLSKLISSSSVKCIQEDQVKQITCQVIKGLKSLKKLRIIHADLKPDNILISSSGEVKIIDFGSSCFSNEKISWYIQSRSYRAPEVILGYNYSFQIDIWSLGCIIYEMMTGQVLFKSKSELDQLNQITALRGQVPLDMIQESAKRNLFYENNILKHSEQSNLKFDVFFSLQTHPVLFDFLSKCLEVDPRKRITVEEAQFHIWANGVRPRFDSRLCLGKKRSLKINCL